jgi:nitroreductase
VVNSFEVLQQIINGRHSTKPAALNGRRIDNETMQQLLALANRAPTHALTEPWRFVVYSGDAVQRFCYHHAEMYKQTTPADKFAVAKYEKQLHNGDKASHIVLVYMKRGSNPNITATEEICATAAAIQNILLGAEALGIAVLWSTGGMVTYPVMKEYLGLAAEDLMIGMLYIGYTDEPVKESKRTPIEDKVRWIT